MHTGWMTSAWGEIVKGLEAAWTAMRRNHAGLPMSRISLVPQGLDDGGITTAGSELQVGEDRLAQGGLAVFATLGHHAAHALAEARGITDLSDGRYHNAKFVTLVTELGLSTDPRRDTRRGYGVVTVPAETEGRYHRVINRLDTLLVDYRPQAPVTERPARLDQLKATCACQPARTFRIAKGVFDLGGIRCDVCKKRFQV